MKRSFALIILCACTMVEGDFARMKWRPPSKPEKRTGADNRK